MRQLFARLLFDLFSFDVDYTLLVQEHNRHIVLADGRAEFLPTALVVVVVAVNSLPNCRIMTRAYAMDLRERGVLLGR